MSYMLSQGGVLGRSLTILSGRPCKPHVFFFLCIENIYIYITSTETILLTVWSHSLLTWPLNRRREYNKQGQSKSNPPSTRCRFGKLYPGKWSFLKPFVVILSCFKIHLLPQSPNSPMVSIHPGITLRIKGLQAREMLSGWPSVCRSCWVSASRSQPFFHIVPIVCGWSQASVSTHASSMRMVVCSSRRCNFCMYCWFVEKLWYMVWFIFWTESMRP